MGCATTSIQISHGPGNPYHGECEGEDSGEECGGDCMFSDPESSDDDRPCGTDLVSLPFFDEGRCRLALPSSRSRTDRPQPKPTVEGRQVPMRPVGKLCPLTYATPGLYTFGIQEWTLADVIVDSGACETVVPKSLCEHIRITPSKQSIVGVEYEVASGETIPNMSARGCARYTPKDRIIIS